MKSKSKSKKALVPKLRFPEFEGEWVEKKLGELTDSYSIRNKDLIDGEIYSVTNSNGFVLQSDHFDRLIASSDLKSYKIIKHGDFAYNPARINIGSIACFRSAPIGIISSLYVCFEVDKDLLDNDFLLNILQLNKTKSDINNAGAGGVRIYVWYDSFSNIKINIPSLPEQQKIANCLSSIDRVIELQEEKITNLTEHKKGLMQQLFPNLEELS